MPRAVLTRREPPRRKRDAPVCFSETMESRQPIQPRHMAVSAADPEDLEPFVSCYPQRLNAAEVSVRRCNNRATHDQNEHQVIYCYLSWWTLPTLPFCPFHKSNTRVTVILAKNNSSIIKRKYPKCIMKLDIS